LNQPTQTISASPRASPFVGLDVSLKETSVCILAQAGTRVFEGKVPSEPAAIARLLRKRAPDLARVSLESGPTSVWLTHALKAEGLPVVCLDARHATLPSFETEASSTSQGENRCD
jgi:transposase